MTDADIIDRGRVIALSGKHVVSKTAAAEHLLPEPAPDDPPAEVVNSVAREPTEPDSSIAGDAFVLDMPPDVPAIWGHCSQVLWARGEALMIAGQQGVGKTTLAGQVIRGLLGIGGDVLGQPITDLGCKILYLAMDRPPQIARSLARQFSTDDRDVLRKRLVVWKGPPPRDLAANPALLAKMADYYGAGVVVVDSLKDAAVRLAEDAVGAQWNRARQHVLAQGVQLLEAHHTTKRGPQGAPVTTVADIYGSTWLTSGCGSIVLLTGEPGDPIVGFRHVKQPAEEVGPYQLAHDQQHGELTIDHQVDLVELVKASGVDGLTAKDAAHAITGKPDPTRAEVEKARRKLDQKATAGILVRLDGTRGGANSGHKGSTPAAWFLAAPDQTRINHGISKTAGQINHASLGLEINHGSNTSITLDPKTAGQINHASNHVNHALVNHETHTPFKGVGSCDPEAERKTP